jgi:hypothetical protein
MMKYIFFLCILAGRLYYQPSAAQPAPAPFASPLPQSVPGIADGPAKLVQFAGRISNDKVVLNWVVDENETADLFEVEKSTDGVNFTMAALVFGTDKPATDKYEFYEKAGNQKTSYRIKLIDKNKKAVYSSIVEIKPAV